MDGLGLQRICFDAEDRPPPSYWQQSKAADVSDDHNCNTPPAGTPNGDVRIAQRLSRIDPQEWLKAPEFVPRSRQVLAECFQRGHAQSFEDSCNANFGPSEPPVRLPSTNGFMNIISESVSPFAASIPTVINMPQPVFPTPSNPAFTVGHPARFPVPRSMGLVRFPLPRLNPPILVRPPLGFVPPGYSANITQINAGIGPPIPALVLKKKRRKRHRRLKELAASKSERKEALACAPTSDTNGYLSESEDVSTRESTQTRLQAASSEPDLNKSSPFKQRSSEPSNLEGNLLGGSCPDLSESQLLLWDNFLYSTVVEGNCAKSSNSPESEDCMQRSEYEVASPAVLSVMNNAINANGIRSKNVRELDRRLQGKCAEETLSEDQLVEKLRECGDNRYANSAASTTKSLKAEIEELSFRPVLSQYGYPQANSSRMHMAMFNPDYNSTTSCIIDRDDDGYVEDCFEGMHIRVNAFDEGDELALSDSELPQPSRFQQIQWALQRSSRHYVKLVAPERVCCAIM